MSAAASGRRVPVGVARCMPEAADLDRQRIAVADDRRIQVLVLQGAKEPFDDAVGLWAPHSGSDVPQQRVAAGERVSEHSPAEAWAVVGDQGDRGWSPYRQVPVHWGPVIVQASLQSLTISANTRSQASASTLKVDRQAVGRR